MAVARWIKLGLGALSLAIVAAAIGAYLVWRDLQEVLDQPALIAAQTEIYEIPRGHTVKRVAYDLQARGWLSRATYLWIEARRLGVSNRIKAGTYEIVSGMSPRDMLALFVEGRTATFTVQFIEGTTFADMMRLIAHHPLIEKTMNNSDPLASLAAVDPAIEHPEGLFFPSTYRFDYGVSDVAVLRRLHSRMQEVLAFHWHTRDPDLPYQTPYEVLIMASIIEKETGRAAERKQIAGVFVRRLKKGMLLQTDPTVIYGIGDGFDGNLTRADLKQDTPYNTYTRGGLPPTPIAMPGEAAIEAAVHPAAGDALYFVAKGDGSHAFSRSLQEHNRAVRRFQLGQD